MQGGHHSGEVPPRANVVRIPKELLSRHPGEAQSEEAEGDRSL